MSVFVTGCSEVLLSINDVSFTNFSLTLVIEEKRRLITNLIVQLDVFVCKFLVFFATFFVFLPIF